MSTAEMTFMFQDVRKATGTAAVALRLVLLPGESLTMPRACATIRVLSGSAWVTEDGKDIVLCAGAVFQPRRPSAFGGFLRRCLPVVSAVGTDALFLEVG